MCILSRGLVSIAANASGDHMTPKLLGYLEARGSDRHHETLVGLRGKPVTVFSHVTCQR